MSFRQAFAASTLLALTPLQSQTPINLNVAAVDGAGRPVSGLRAGDFQVFDGGKPRAIVWFHPIAATDQSDFAPATFILLDLLNADAVPGWKTADRDSILTKLSGRIADALEQFDPRGRVYLYLLTPNAQIVAVHGVEPAGTKPVPGSEWARRVRPMLEAALRETPGPGPMFFLLPIVRMEPTWRALTAMIPQMAEVPGPKSFVWISQGVPSLNLEAWRRRRVRVAAPSLQEFAAGLNAVGTAAYGVHQPEQIDMFQFSGNVDSPLEALKRLSELTGGRTYMTDDVTPKAIRDATSDASVVNYRIAFLADRPDRKYRKIRVVAAREGIKVQSAECYDADLPASAAPLEGAIENAVALSPFHHPDIGFTATAATVPGSPDAYRFSLELDPRDMMLLKDGARYQGSLDIVLVEISSRGERHMIPAKTADVQLSEQEYADALNHRLDITREANLDAQTRQVRVVVFDRKSSLSGTLTVALPSTEK